MNPGRRLLWCAVLSGNAGLVGQALVEYLMILALIAMGLMVALVAFQAQMSSALSSLGAGL